MPGVQGWHCSALVAAAVVEYVPAMHWMHVLEPPDAHVPARQARQASMPAAPMDAEYFPAAQLKHAAAAVAATTDDHVPAPHCTHVPAPAAAHAPGAHDTHAEAAPAPGVLDDEPAPHGRHVPAAVAPAHVEYVPAAHVAHAVAPVVLEYVPGAHREQGWAASSGLPAKPGAQASAAKHVAAAAAAAGPRNMEMLAGCRNDRRVPPANRMLKGA